MKSILRFILVFSMGFTTLLISAQNATLRGKITDSETGEDMPFVNVILAGTQIGATSDLDGAFTIIAPAGTYDIQLSFISYQTKTIKGVLLKAGKVTLLENIPLAPASAQLDEVTVSAEMARNTETAIQTLKMKSATVMDGISSANFKKIGDSDAASSMKRVTGVSVQDGKYVYVRGLGDRYTKTMLNGMDVPGLDPDRNTMQMDIFPTSILDNIIVHKSFIAELPADFTGGVVDINTKSFPETKTANISVGIGYSPNFHFRDDYLSYQGGNLDFLGVDDGTRKIPIEGDNIPQFVNAIANPNGEAGIQYKENLANFNPIMAAARGNSLMDASFGFDFGNQKQLGKYALGYNFVFNYSNETRFFQDVEYGRFGINQQDNSIFEQERREFTVGDLGTNEIMMSGMAGFSLKSQKSKYIFNLMRLQNGVSKAAIFDYFGTDQGAEFDALQHNLDYSQRELTNLMIAGNTLLNTNGWEFDWKVSSTLSTLDDPDIRFTRYQILSNNLLKIGTEAGLPERIWRDLSEFNVAGFAQMKKNYKWRGKAGKMNFGLNYVFKTRDYNIRNFQFEVRGAYDLTGNPNELFFKENLWPIEENVGRGTTYNVPWISGSGAINNPNQYSSNNSNLAGFYSTEYNVSNRLRAILGLRFEYFRQQYTGTNQQGFAYVDSLVLNEFNLFPTANLVYALNEKQNLRLSGSKTIARPSFKELSFAEIFDPITGRTFIGGLFPDLDPRDGDTIWDGRLTSTDIYNFDLRWEFFPTYSSIYSLGAFYKSFNNPIEIIQYATQANAFQPRNVGDGQLVGAELEVRQNLEFVSSYTKNFVVNFNFTYTYSRIELSRTERESRIENARVGQEIGTHRDMAGQAPYIINGGFSYDGNRANSTLFKNLEAGIFYNVQGPMLIFAGIVDRPDIYSEPFHSLNLTFNKKFGKDNRMNIGLKVSNLLGDVQEEFSIAFQAQNQVFTRINPGRVISASFSYKL